MNKRNKKIYMLVLTTIFTILITANLSLNVSAHPASEMSLNYNKNNNILEVTISHQVSDPGEHYIDNLTISLNGEIHSSYKYTSQPTSSSFTYTYELNASEEDTIEVYTHCNLGGTLTEELNVKSTSDTSTSEPGLTVESIVYFSILGIPFIVHLGIITLFIFILTACLAILKRRGKVKYPLKLHIWLAYLAIILGIIHGILGLLIYI